MKRIITIIASVAVAFIASTAAADTHLWLTTEGAGVEITTGEEHRPPPPPPHHRHCYEHGYCKICKKHHKEMKKAAKKHHKNAHKSHHKPHKHHHR